MCKTLFFFIGTSSLDSPKCGEHLFFPGETLILPRPNVLNIVFFRAKPRWTAPNVVNIFFFPAKH